MFDLNFTFDNNDPVKSNSLTTGQGGVLGMKRYSYDIATEAFSGTQKMYYLFDELGSVVTITDAYGMPLKYYIYDPWGDVVNTESDPINNLTFIGRYGGIKDWDTGFIQFQHRWYDSFIGKWISRDPIGVEGGVNVYNYTANNPVNNIDPIGLCEKKPILDWEHVHFYHYCGKDWTAGQSFTKAEQNTHKFYENFMYKRPQNATDQCCYNHDSCAYRVRMGFDTTRTITDCNKELIDCTSRLIDVVAQGIRFLFIIKPHMGDPQYGEDW